MMRRLVFVFLLIGGFGASSAWAGDIFVGAQDRHKTIAAGVRASSPGDRLVIREGTYLARDVSIPHDLTLVGDGSVTITSEDPVAKGLLVPLSGSRVTVENMTFEGAVSPDRNGAGIRFEGASLIVRYSTFRDNENGILATGDDFGSVLIERSLFQRNGHGDGYSHAIYQSRGGKLTVSGSVFQGTKVGHHVKSLASLVVVTGSNFDDGAGRTSYVVDATGGGKLYIADNTVLRRASADQDNLFNYDTTRRGALGTVTILNNVLTTEKRRVRVLRNPEGARLESDGNRLQRAASGSFRDAVGPVVDVPAAAPLALPAPRRRVAAEPLRSESAIVDPREAQLAALSPRQRRALKGLIAAEAPRAEASSGLISSPHFADLPQGAAAQIRLRSTGATGPYVTFGQMFPIGAVRPGQALRAIVQGKDIPVQLDGKALHPDGSVRHGVVTLWLAPGVHNDQLVQFFPAQYPQGGQASLPPVPSISLSALGVLGGGADRATVMLTPPANAQVWMAGPLAREVSWRASLGPLLSVRIDQRQYADGSVRRRLTFENIKTFSSLPRDLQYRVRVNQDAEMLLEETIGKHYRNSQWTVVLGNGRAAYHVVHDPRHLIATGAIPPLDLGVGIHPQVFGADIRDIRPGTYGIVLPYMPTTGARRDIGPMTAWSAAWAMTQTPEGLRAVLDAADVGLTIPWSFAEDATGLPVQVDQRRSFWADARGSKTNFAPDNFPVGIFEDTVGGWTTDLAHKPSLAYPAYLATGEAVYARALAFEAGYAVAGVWPDLRGSNGMLITRDLQLRGVAWGLRTIGNAAYLLPADDPMKAYASRVLAANMRDLENTYLRRRIMADAGETEGYFETDAGRDRNAIAPWQNDFMAIVLSMEAWRGTPGALELAQWMTPFVAGRVIAAKGDLNLMAAATHTVIGPNGRRYADWESVYSASVARGLTGVSAGDADGYYGVLKAATNALSLVVQDPRLAIASRTLNSISGGDALRAPANSGGYSFSPQYAFTGSRP